MAPAGAAF